MTEQTFRRVLLGIVLGAVLLRILYTVIVLQPLPPGSFSDVGHLPFRPIDEVYYEMGARAFSYGRVFRFSFFGPMREQAYLPPLTSLILTPAGLVSDALLPMRIVGVLGGGALVVLVALVGRAVSGARAGVGAAVLAAIYPNLWMNDGLLLAETWAAVATALVLLATYRFLMHRTTGRAGLIGLACGVATLARSELVLLMPLLAVYLLVLRGSARSQQFLQAGALVGAGLLALAPWIAYNASRFERPVLLTTGVGDVLLGANCPTTYYGDRIGSTDSKCPLLPESSPDDDPSIVAEERRDVALQYMRDHIERVPLVILAREGRVWSLYAPRYTAFVQQADGRPTWGSYLGLAMYWGLVPAAIIGVAVLHRTRRPLFPLIAPTVVVALNAALTYGYVRYRVPAETSFVILAGAAVGTFWDARAGRLCNPVVPAG